MRNKGYRIWSVCVSVCRRSEGYSTWCVCVSVYRPAAILALQGSHTTKLSITAATSAIQLTFVLLKRRLNRPKHQSWLNLVCQTTTNDYVMLVKCVVFVLSSPSTSISLPRRFVKYSCQREDTRPFLPDHACQTYHDVGSLFYFFRLVSEEVYLARWNLSFLQIKSYFLYH